MFSGSSMDKALVLLQYGIDGLVRGCSNSIANGKELLQICSKPSRYPFATHHDLRSVHSWWRHQMETFSALLTLRAANSPVTCEFPSQRPVMRSFDVFFEVLGVQHVDPACAWYSASIAAIIDAISYYIGPRYNGTRLCVSTDPNVLMLLPHICRQKPRECTK